LALVVFPLIGVGLSAVLDKRYTAQMRLMVDTSVKGYDVAQSPFAAIDDVFSQTRPRSTETQVQILTGANVLGSAIEKSAEKYPNEFRGNISEQYESLIRRLAVESNQTSDIIAVRVTMANPEVAAETANNIGISYIEYMNSLSNSSGQGALSLVNEQLNKIKTSLDQLDADIAAAKEGAQIGDAQISAQSTTSAINAYENRYYELLATLEGSRAELQSSQAQLVSMPKSIQTSDTTTVNPALQTLEVDLTREEAALDGYKSRYLDDHPFVKEQAQKVKNLRAAKDRLSKEIKAQRIDSINVNRQQIELSVTGLKSRVANLEMQVDEAKAALDGAKAKLAVIPQLESKLNKLMRRRQVLEASFAQLDQRREILETTGSGRKSPANIVSMALAPTQPSFPDPRLFFLMGLAVGVIVAALVIMPRGDMDVYGQWAIAAPDKKKLAGRKGKAKNASIETSGSDEAAALPDDTKSDS